MRRFFALIFCGLLLLSLVACGQTKDGFPEDGQVPSTEEEPEVPSYTFVSRAVRNTWKADLLDIFSKVDIWDPERSMFGSHEVGLMDLNFDGVPEVLVVAPGGSMGNVFITIYDLETKQRLVYYNAAHFAGESDLRLYVAMTGDGAFVTLTEGSIRDPECGWVELIDQIPDPIETEETYLYTQNLLAKSERANTDGDGPYFVRGKSVEQAVYEEEYRKFLNDYTPLAATELQPIQWATLDLNQKEQLAERMADALINSSQQFIDFKNS